jgi:hypothetical protein
VQIGFHERRAGELEHAPQDRQQCRLPSRVEHIDLDLGLEGEQDLVAGADE